MLHCLPIAACSKALEQGIAYNTFDVIVAAVGF